jgi:hypothetical protein
MKIFLSLLLLISTLSFGAYVTNQALNIVPIANDHFQSQLTLLNEIGKVN